MKKCIVLFSGGIDSTTALFWALQRYDDVSALTFDYEQRNKVEILAAKETVKILNTSHQILKVDLGLVGGSALTDPDIALPESHQKEALPPQTYVPFRNGIFISLAAAWGEARGILDIVCGFNAIDSPNYPDTSRPFVTAMEDALNLGTKSAFSEEKFRLHIPFIDKKKSEIIRKGLELGADYSHSVSCYAGNEIPCQKCSSCLLRKKAWDEVGEEDHLLVRLREEGKI